MAYVFEGKLFCDKCGEKIIESMEANWAEHKHKDADGWPQHMCEEDVAILEADSGKKEQCFMDASHVVSVLVPQTEVAGSPLSSDPK